MADEIQPATTGQEPPPQASLLGMPAEIRNRIYREVLVDHEDGSCLFHETLDYPDCVRKENTKQPGLLRCCAQIRQEALLVFLQENSFSTWILEGKLEPQLEHWFWKIKVRSIGVLPDVKWKNLKVWLEAYWNGRLSGSLYNEVFNFSDDAVFTACMGAGEMVRHLERASWEVVEAVLEEFATTIKTVGEGGHLLED